MFIYTEKLFIMLNTDIYSEKKNVILIFRPQNGTTENRMNNKTLV